MIPLPHPAASHQAHLAELTVASRAEAVLVGPRQGSLHMIDLRCLAVPGGWRRLAVPMLLAPVEREAA
jgi:hypothetical protein